MGLDMCALVTAAEIPAVDFEQPDDAVPLCYWHNHYALHWWIAPLYCERRGRAKVFNCKTIRRLVQENLETFLAQVEAERGSGLPEFVKAEFDAFLACGILAHGFLCLRCADCGHEKLVAFSCKRRGFCPSCGARAWRKPPPVWSIA
jgi:Transposase zinc-binding domain